MEQEYDKKLLLEIAHKLREGTASDQEQAYFDKWYTHHKDELLELPEGYASNPLVIRNRMHDKLLAQVAAETKTFKFSGIWWSSAAAAVVLICGLLFYMNRDQLGTVKPGVAIAQEDIAPGKTGATLTLANGKKIRLADAANGEIAKEAGVIVTKTADGQVVYEMKSPAGEHTTLSALNTLSTAKGEMYILILPDKSKVWMNSASSITYSSTLKENGVRKVKLEGEAYFEISKDKVHPFIVETAKQEVEVLGTHFNISSYADEKDLKTTLLEGSIKISSSSEHKIIKPGQQSIIIGTRIHVKDVIADDAIAWKNGYFMFDNESLENIMVKISRWYNIEIIYDDPSVKAETFFGTMSRYENISKILNMLERTGVVKFTIERNVIRVARKE